ncbi:hypothetical protein [Mesorhizobium sp. M0138]|uniref:hypothetical protein n=1 Tax=Mesorhizobium sp. M0138 TaxID=2956891 RepID=UPI00333744E2
MTEAGDQKQFFLISCDQFNSFDLDPPGVSTGRLAVPEGTDCNLFCSSLQLEQKGKDRTSSLAIVMAMNLKSLDGLLTGSRSTNLWEAIVVPIASRGVV